MLWHEEQREEESSNADKVISSHALNTLSSHALVGSICKGRALQSLRQRHSRQEDIGRWENYLVYRQCPVAARGPRQASQIVPKCETAVGPNARNSVTWIQKAPSHG